MQVYVDEDFARFGSKSYAINKINSVEVRERSPYTRGPAILCAMIAAFAGLAFLGSLAAPEGALWPLAIVAAFFGWLAWRGFAKAKIREYQLFLMTSSSEAQVFVTRDEGEVHSLREQIETAMLGHSRRGAP